jgi:hypothetical protein
MRQTEEASARLLMAMGGTGSVAQLDGATLGKVEASGALPIVPQHVHHDRDSEVPETHQEPNLDTTAQEGVSLLGETQPTIPEHVAQDGSENAAAIPFHFTHKLLPYRTDASIGCDESKATESAEPILNGVLRLEVLELERVPLSVPVLLKAFDWTLLTTLTLLHCNNHEQLWKSLRRTYTPRSPYPAGSPSSSSKAYKASYTLRTEYGLSLKKVHTNAVSPALISFLKETLAPNTLEVLFLQEGRSYSSTVTVDAIYRGPLRRHRGSLKKLMIDSSEKGPDGHATTSSRWRRWMLNREIITFISSGRMNGLRELAVSIDYKDWVSYQ